MLKRTALLALFVTLSLPALLRAQDCNLSFAGTARKAVKLRTKAAGDDYEQFKDGNPISVTEWFVLTCALDGSVPTKVPATKPIEGIETTEVTVRGFLQGVKFEDHKKSGDGKDNDFHVEIGSRKKWESPHIVVEVPPGDEYCDAEDCDGFVPIPRRPPHAGAGQLHRAVSYSVDRQCCAREREPAPERCFIH